MTPAFLGTKGIRAESEGVAGGGATQVIGSAELISAAARLVFAMVNSVGLATQ